jgi:hypothetical protein
MVGDSFDLLGGAVAGKPLEGFHNPSVECPPLLLKETTACHLLGEDVFEDIDEVGGKTRLVQELGGLDGREGVVEFPRWPPGDGMQQGERHVFANHGCRLEEVLLLSGSPAMPTTCPRPPSTCAKRSCRIAISRSRPTKRLRVCSPRHGRRGPACRRAVESQRFLLVGLVGSENPTRANFPFAWAAALREAGHEVRIELAGDATVLMRTVVANSLMPVGWPPEACSA